MVSQISVVINTFNEEKNIKKIIESLEWASEIVVVDDGSTDKTFQILVSLKRQKANLKIFKHKSAGYVEPARNFAISKTSNEWILIVDADEEIPRVLVERLQEIAKKMHQVDYVRIPRKNVIFGHWMQHSGWWPDYNIRFFKKNKVRWTNKIHRPPESFGQGLDLPAEEKYALVHYSYESISQFLERMNKYTEVEAEELKRGGYKFRWSDFIEKPLGEFLSRFFAREGYRDGLHGLALSLLQVFSFLAVYLKLWEKTKFKEETINLEGLENQMVKSAETMNYWMKKTTGPENFFKRLLKSKLGN